MAKSALSQDHLYVAGGARIASIDSAIEQAAEVQRECRNRVHVVVGEIRSGQQSIRTLDRLLV